LLINFFLGNTTDISSKKYKKYKIFTLSSHGVKYSNNHLMNQHTQFSNKITSRYIDKIKSTKQCKRMRIENQSQTSLMATFSRGRLGNQMCSFALQYAIRKVIIKKGPNANKLLYSYLLIIIS